MAILAYDEVMLREPRLLVPRLAPIGKVKLDLTHPAISYLVSTDWGMLDRRNILWVLNDKFYRAENELATPALIGTPTTYMWCPAGYGPSTRMRERGCSTFANNPTRPTLFFMTYVASYGTDALNLIFASGPTNTDEMPFAVSVNTAGNLYVQCYNGITWEGPPVPLNRTFCGAVGVKADNTLFVYVDGVDLNASSAAITATYCNCIKRKETPPSGWSTSSDSKVITPFAIRHGKAQNLDAILRVTQNLTQLLIPA